jgi:hypothetical protein
MRHDYRNDIESFIDAGASMEVAETLSKMIANYMLDSEVFEDGYWVWKLEKLGIKTETAEAYIELMKKPDLIKQILPHEVSFDKIERLVNTINL